MKKQLLALAILGSGLAGAQNWSEDFNSTTASNLPAGWFQNNVDGLTVAANLSAWNLGTNAWVTRDMSAAYPAYGRVAGSASWYTPVGTANDWLITHNFNVMPNAILEWDAAALDPQFPDGYQVKISTSGTLVANFTNLQTVNAENSTWTNRSLSLNTYSGQAVHIAFVNNSNDQFVLMLDNIRVKVPQANDGGIVDISSLTRYSVAGNQNIAGTFKSEGSSPATSAVINYNINNGAVQTQNLTFSTPLNYGQSVNYSFATPANLAVGVHRVKTWVSQVNSVNELNFLNDTAYSTVYVASQSSARNVLIEEWSSSTCAPCANLNVTNGFDALLNSNNPNTGGDVNVVKYQVNWPSPGNDPSYNAHCLARRMHYDVNAAPTTIMNGISEMQAHDQNEIDNAKTEPAFATIYSSVSANGSTLATAPVTVVATATITPFLTISANSPLRVYQAVVQNSYRYNAATTLQKEYFHVMRRMTDGGWGSPVTVTDGTPFTVSFTHNASTLPVDPTLPNTALANFNMWRSPTATPPTTYTNVVYEYVVWLQDTISNDIIQSSSWTSTVTLPTVVTPTVITVGLSELTKNNQIGIYPVPANDYAVIAINLEQSATVDVTILDIAGRVVYTNKGTKLSEGKHEMNVNTADLPTGTYNVMIKSNDTVSREKLLISK